MGIVVGTSLVCLEPVATDPTVVGFVHGIADAVDVCVARVLVCGVVTSLSHSVVVVVNLVVVGFVVPIPVQSWRHGHPFEA